MVVGGEISPTTLTGTALLDASGEHGANAESKYTPRSGQHNENSPECKE